MSQPETTTALEMRWSTKKQFEEVERVIAQLKTAAVRLDNANDLVMHRINEKRGGFSAY